MTKTTKDAKHTETPAKAQAAKTSGKKPAKKRQPKLDHARLADLAARIGAWPRGNMTDLAAQLANEDGLKFRQTSEGHTYARMASIEAGARGGEGEALVNWANAARRTTAGAV